MRFDNVLVTGGSGQLGGFVVEELMDRSRVSVLDITPPRADVPYHAADILDREGVAAAVTGHDAVIHLAALDAAIDASEQEFFETNVQGLWNVLEAAEDAGVRRAVVCSSVAAYNISEEHPPRYLPVDVHHPVAPVTAYGLSKQAGEVIASGFARRSPMEVVCLRPTLVMQSDIAYDLALKTVDSDGAPPPPQAFDESWRTLSEQIPGSRSFVGPSDAARCFAAALEAEGRFHAVYNVAAADTYSPLQTLEVVDREFGVRPEIRDAELYAHDPRASIYDISLTRDELGWEPRERWADLLERVVAEAGGPDAGSTRRSAP
jgi:nucleoside-diphosphate-sugar epimerase